MVRIGQRTACRPTPCGWCASRPSRWPLSRACSHLLDFIDATPDPAGRVLVDYADGCTAACVSTTSPTSTTTGYRDALATIARQSSGLRVYDAKPNLTLGAIVVSRDSSQRADLVWKSAKKGTHIVTAVVDPANTVAESREDDNKSQAVVTVA